MIYYLNRKKKTSTIHYIGVLILFIDYLVNYYPNYGMNKRIINLSNYINYNYSLIMPFLIRYIISSIYDNSQYIQEQQFVNKIYQMFVRKVNTVVQNYSLF